jgi:hypothetical protein
VLLPEPGLPRTSCAKGIVANIPADVFSYSWLLQPQKLTWFIPELAESSQVQLWP